MGQASKNKKVRQSRDFVAKGRNFHPFGCSSNGEEAMLPVAGVHSPSQPGVPPSYLGCRGAATWNSPGTTEATSLMGSIQDTARLTTERAQRFDAGSRKEPSCCMLHLSQDPRAWSVYYCLLARYHQQRETVQVCSLQLPATFQYLVSAPIERTQSESSWQGHLRNGHWSLPCNA